MNGMPARLVPPHGGALRPLLVHGEELAEERERAQGLPQISLSTKETSDLIMLAIGAYSPLDGFLCRADYLRVVEEMQLSSGVTWPMPITLSASRERTDSIHVGQDVALVDGETGETLGLMRIREKYPYDKHWEATKVFGTDDARHPGVERTLSQAEMYLGGTVKVLSEGRYPQLFPEFARPNETREIFAKRGWSMVVGFQTRNPIHRSHEYLLRIAMEISDGVFIHPIVGALKPGDVPADVRMRCYRVLIDKYLPADRVVLSVYPMEMRYGGPREAVLHAIIRQNYGCSHLIVGRDHAGVGNFYGPFDAQRIFAQLKADALAIRPMNLDWTFWCRKCEGMASPKTCPHDAADRLLISGTQLRSLLASGRRPPAEYSRPEVLDILADYYRSQGE
jgi:sulfate adenylyltransferase